jgi:hypothetical protein
MSRASLAAISLCLFAVPMTGSAAPGPGSIPAAARLPDMRTVVPQHLQVVNPAKGTKREVLRFSNGVANMGDGPWRMRPEFPLGDITQPQKAVQELLNSTDSSGGVVYEKVVSQFEYHPTHNHWHIDGIALFEVRASLGHAAGAGRKDIGGVVGGNSIKTTFCLIDWVRYEGNSNTGKKTDRVYFDCAGAYQGVSVGWVDQYHQATDGQELDLTGLAAGYYYLVSVANPDGVFLEKSTSNNRAWVFFELRRDSEGNAKLEVIADSFEIDGEGLPDTYSANR